MVQETMNQQILKQDLITDEGKSNCVYPDSLGYATIGVGRLVDKRRGGCLSDDEIDLLLTNDIKKVTDQLDTKLPWWRQMSEPRQRALANMTFNLGIDGVLKFKNTLAMLQAGNYAGAADGMLQSLWAKQVGKRAQRLSDLVRNG